MHDHLHRRLPAYLSDLRALVEVNSFTENVAGIRRQGELTADLFAPLGFRPEFRPSRSPAFGPHLFLHRPASTLISPVHIALVSHLDTVFTPAEESAENFTWREDGERIYGPGVADIKGGTVVAFMALDALHACHPDLFDRVSWVVALDAAEEQMDGEFASLLRDRLPAGRTWACLVFECGATGAEPQTPLVITRKGMSNFQVAVTGQAAHAGTGFWRGRNAILAAARLALSAADLSDRSQERTVNVGTMAGGTVTNRVPHACSFAGEIRAFDPAVLSEGMRLLQEVVEREPGAGVEFLPLLPPWPTNPGSNGLLEVFRAVGADLGLKITPERRGGLSDGNFLWDHAPTIDGLGPLGGNCHCSQAGADGSGQEYAQRSSFVTKALLTARALRELAAS
jgi:glutamate carboxypeptidase